MYRLLGSNVFPFLYDTYCLVAATTFFQRSPFGIKCNFYPQVQNRLSSSGNLTEMEYIISHSNRTIIATMNNVINVSCILFIFNI